MKWVLQIMGFTLYTWDYCFNYEFFNIIIHPCQRQLRRDYIIVFVIFNCIQIIIFIWDIDILSHPSPFLRLPFPYISVISQKIFSIFSLIFPITSYTLFSSAFESYLHIKIILLKIICKF